MVGEGREGSDLSGWGHWAHGGAFYWDRDVGLGEDDELV